MPDAASNDDNEGEVETVGGNREVVESNDDGDDDKDGKDDDNIDEDEEDGAKTLKN